MSACLLSYEHSYQATQAESVEITREFIADSSAHAKIVSRTQGKEALASIAPASLSTIMPRAGVLRCAPSQ